MLSVHDKTAYCCDVKRKIKKRNFSFTTAYDLKVVLKDGSRINLATQRRTAGKKRKWRFKCHIKGNANIRVAGQPASHVL